MSPNGKNGVPPHDPEGSGMQGDQVKELRKAADPKDLTLPVSGEYPLPAAAIIEAVRSSGIGNLHLGRKGNDSIRVEKENNGLAVVDRTGEVTTQVGMAGVSTGTRSPENGRGFDLKKAFQWPVKKGEEKMFAGALRTFSEELAAAISIFAKSGASFSNGFDGMKYPHFDGVKTPDDSARFAEVAEMRQRKRISNPEKFFNDNFEATAVGVKRSAKMMQTFMERNDDWNGLKDDTLRHLLGIQKSSRLEGSNPYLLMIKDQILNTALVHGVCEIGKGLCVVYNTTSNRLTLEKVGGENTYVGNLKYENVEKDGGKVSVLSNNPENPREGIATVFIHGMCHGAGAWTSVLRECEKLGMKAAAINLTGHEENADKSNYLASLERYLADIKIVVDDLMKNGAEKIVLCGHSMGGYLVPCFLAKYSELAKFIDKAVCVAAPTPSMVRAATFKIALRHPWEFLKGLLNFKGLFSNLYEELCLSSNGPEGKFVYAFQESGLRQESVRAYLEMLLGRFYPSSLPEGLKIINVAAANDELCPAGEVHERSAHLSGVAKGTTLPGGHIEILTRRKNAQQIAQIVAGVK